MDLSDGSLAELRQVSEYEYLGIVQKITLVKTMNAKCATMVTKANSFLGSILKLRNTMPDQVDSYRAMWENIALPSILYGCDALPIDELTIYKLELAQRHIARSLLGVPKSSLNEITQLEMGFKPIILLVLQSKIKFYLKTQDQTKGCIATSKCMDMLKTLRKSEYLCNLDILLKEFGLTYLMIDDTSVAKIEGIIISRLLTSLSDRSSLKILPAPTKFWRMSVHVEEGAWSKALSQFRCMNAGLGNRDIIYKDYAVYVEDGRIVNCPLCTLGDNDEVHLLTGCPNMSKYRRSIKLGGKTLREVLYEISRKYNPPSKQALARLFVGQQAGLTRVVYIRRGHALIELVDAFFNAWSTKFGSRIERS